MIHYVHSLPGRLRVRITRLKNNPQQAERLKAVLAARPDVLSVESNELTGGAVIRFDHRQTSAGAILDYLEELGYRRVGEAATATGKDSRGSSGVIERAGTQIASAVLEKVIERSVIALIGALV